MSTQAPESPQPSEDFADRVMAALPPEPRGEIVPMPRASAPHWGLRVAAAAALFAAGVLTANALDASADTAQAPLANVPEERQALQLQALILDRLIVLRSVL